jgi:homoserine O-acetyltransferase
MVRAQFALLDHPHRAAAASGASLGGMQSLLLAALTPERVARVVTISAALPASAVDRVSLRAATAVMADPDWRGGRYYGVSFPHRGQRIAREIGTITYRSGPEWQERFGRERGDDGPPRLDEDFQVERYLAHQGDRFCLQYDANSYLYISKAMDLFDLLAERDDGPPVARIQCPSLVIERA